MAVYISPIEQYIIDAVTAFRHSKNITQRELAATISTTRGFISNIENANHPAAYNLNHLNAISFYFKVPVRSFFPEKPLPEKKIRKKSQGQTRKRKGAKKMNRKRETRA